MLNKSTVLLILSYLAANLLRVEAITSALKRQTLIFHEPPYENNLERADQVTEHYITQRLDNFDHQNQRTFKMVWLKLFFFFFKYPCMLKSAKSI